jgi:hypothetical protein
VADLAMEIGSIERLGSALVDGNKVLGRIDSEELVDCKEDTDCK